MKVKIKKARLNSYWYFNKIGQEFEVFPYLDGDLDFKVKGKGNYISKEDCIITNATIKEINDLLKSLGVMVDSSVFI